MRARTSETISADEDMSDKAGWLYADLFLALMVIFLATISFVPEIRQSTENSNSVRIQSSTIKQSTNYNFDQGLTLLLDAPDGQLISSRITQFLADSKLPRDAEVVFMKLIGGFADNPSGESAATTRAIKYGMTLKNENPELFSLATLSVDISESVDDGKVALVLTFAAIPR
jgi:hypothetical protein